MTQCIVIPLEVFPLRVEFDFASRKTTRAHTSVYTVCPPHDEGVVPCSPPPDIFDQYAALCNLKGIHIYTLPVMLSYKGRVLIISLAFITNMSLLRVMQMRVKKVEKVSKRSHAIC